MLKDLKKLFGDENANFLATTFILNKLNKMEERPWPEYRRGEPITAQQLAALLRPFGIKPRQKRKSNSKKNPVRGYRLRHCRDPFARYVG